MIFLFHIVGSTAKRRGTPELFRYPDEQPDRSRGVASDEMAYKFYLLVIHVNPNSKIG